MFLSKAKFYDVLENTPLVSIDLVLENSEGQVLLGKRKNRPAQGYWFVPGGRIFKSELLADAFSRLTKEELGQEISINNAALQGAYDHFYKDSIFGDHPSTHYVALAYRLKVETLCDLPDGQHLAYRWFSIEGLLDDKLVHQNTKAYFV